MSTHRMYTITFSKKAANFPDLNFSAGQFDIQRGPNQSINESKRLTCPNVQHRPPGKRDGKDARLSRARREQREVVAAKVTQQQIVS